MEKITLIIVPMLLGIFIATVVLICLALFGRHVFKLRIVRDYNHKKFWIISLMKPVRSAQFRAEIIQLMSSTDYE